MKKFDLEAAKAGAPIVTRDGREARFIAHVPEASRLQQVVYLIGQTILVTAVSGKFDDGEESCDDLFMKPQKKTVFVNLMRRDSPLGYEHHYSIHPTADKAHAIARNVIGTKILAIAVPIEIEE